jgi:hypothetical protein
VNAFVVTSPEEANFVRMQIAFYASTPSYRPVFEHHGWGKIGEKLSGHAARGQWGEMGSLIDDEILNTFAVVADPQDVPEIIFERYQHLADRLTLYIPFIPGERDEFWSHLITSLT